jgi:hypothetical protein
MAEKKDQPPIVRVKGEDWTVRIEPEEVTERLHGNDGAGNGFIFRNRILEKTLQGIPGVAAEGGKELSIIQKVTTQYFRDTKDKMPVRNLLEDVHAQPLPEFHHALLVTGRAEVAALAGKCQQVFMAAVFAFHTGKTVLQIAAIQNG